MSEAILEPPPESLHGKLSKNSNIIFRRKTPQVSSKRAISCGPQEAYVITKPRDWKKNPPRGAELEKINRFREACRLTSEQLSDPETRAVWEQRFNDQLRRPRCSASPLHGTTKSIYPTLGIHACQKSSANSKTTRRAHKTHNPTPQHKTITCFPRQQRTNS